MKIVAASACCAGIAILAWSGHVVLASSRTSVEAAVTSKVLVSGVSRFGINLGGWSFWGADQFPSNILKNPGFEGLLDGAIVIPAHSGLGSFDDNQSWLARPDGFWEGAHYSIRSGPNAGREGTVVHSSINLWGLPSFVTQEGDPLPDPGDAVAILKDTETDIPTQWWYSNDPGNTFRSENQQVRPGSSGARSLRIKAAATVPATVASYLDSIGDRSGNLLPLSGTWNLSFWVRLDSGNASLHVVFGRQGSTALLSQDVAISNSWKNVQLTFAGVDDGPVGTVNLQFQTTGLPVGEILLDDVDLRRTADANQPFRHEVVSMLNQLHPAYLRDWQGQLGDTIANRTADQFARKSYRYRPGDSGQTDYGYGLRDFLDLCIKLKASPWIIIPTVFNDADCTGLGDYLAAQSDLDAKREIVVEFGNENWNSLFRPASIPDPIAHGEASGRCFAAIRGHAAGLKVKTAINVQADYPAGAIAFAQNSSSDIVSLAPYFFYSLSAGLRLPERVTQLFQQNQANTQAIDAAVSPANRELAVYEVNLHNIEGNATANERRPVVAGIASGAALAKNMLDNLAMGVRRQCAYSLTGFDSQLTSQPGFVPLWGMARDVGPTQRFRPTGLALALLNEAVQGDMVSVRTDGPKDVFAYGFKSSESWSAVFISTSDVDRRVNFATPEGVKRVRLHSLLSDAPDSNNEDGDHVRIQREFMATSSGKASFNLRPWSVAVILSVDRDAEIP